MSAELAIGVDLGATKIAAALVARTGEVLAEARTTTTAAAGVAGVVARIEATIAELAGQAPGPVAGIGIGTPGYVDPVAGVVRNAVNLGWSEVDLAGQVQSALARLLPDRAPPPVWVDNDANVQALGECVFGAARGLDNMVYVGIGSGLGSGVVVQGRLVSGASHTAAEMGHLSLDPAGRRCACGLRGCVETVVSGPGLVATVRELLTAPRAATTLANTPDLTAEAVVAAARGGDALAAAAIAETARWLGIVFAAFVAILNPAAIVVGGGLGHSAFDLLVPGARTEMMRRVPKDGYSLLQIVPSHVHSSAVGASSLVWQARS
jgi:glucokinase